MTNHTWKSVVASLGNAANMFMNRTQGGPKSFTNQKDGSWLTCRILLAALLLGFTVTALGPSKAAASDETAAAKTQPSAAQQRTGAREPTKEERETWRRVIVKTRRPKRGCFEADYPETQWREVPCVKAPKRPYPRKKGVPPSADVVGGSLTADFSAKAASGNISIAEGSFDSVTGVGSETGSNGLANSFSLQLNSQTFGSAACGSVSGCQAWEQFIYSNSNCENSGLYPHLNSKACAFIQYWLIDYGSCPSSSWNSDGFGDCYINSTNAAAVPHPPASTPTIGDLGDMKLTGEVAGVGGNTDDSVTFTLGTTAYTASGDDYISDLATKWQAAEFNIFGDGGGETANFTNATSQVATLVVRTEVDSGTTAAPTCVQESFTAEMNNLNLTTAPAPSADQYPSVIFTEANAGSSTPACATSHGDTHLRTFDGLYYDFQASGDFVLADASPDFIVHTRQASGAPFWPKAAVNKAVAVQMGKTRAALYAEPTRLLIDGRPTDLAEGKTIKVGDIQLTRWRDDEYVFVSPTGDVVYAQINIVPKPAMTWIDVGVSMSSEHHDAARGLLGNPHGNAEELAAADGKVFHEPVSFDDLYHGYGESWRVRAEDSLFTEHSTIKPGIPDAPFYAEHLDPQEQARVRAICTGAGVTNEALLAACMLDTAVLGTNKAVKVFVNAAPPRHVIKPVVHPKP